jgi:hypothetical protein
MSNLNNDVKVPIFKNLFYSASATGIAEIITLPVCTLKTNFQNSSSTSIVETVKNIYTKEGVKAFYKASFPAITSQMFSTSTKYVMYKYLDDRNFFSSLQPHNQKGYHETKSNHSAKIVNGILSGILISLVTHPLDVVKINLQNVMFKSSSYDKPKVYSSTSTSFHNKLKVYYQGYSKTLSKVIVGSALFFPLKDIYSDFFKKQQERNHKSKSNNDAFHLSLKSSFCSAITSTIIIHPIDYLKTRHIGNQTLYNGWNPKIYYKGISLNLLRVVPHFTITMTLIDIMTKMGQ